MHLSLVWLIEIFRNKALPKGQKALAKQDTSMIDFLRVGNMPMPN